jgi:hypothetical protein
MYGLNMQIARKNGKTVRVNMKRPRYMHEEIEIPDQWRVYYGTIVRTGLPGPNVDEWGENVRSGIWWGWRLRRGGKCIDGNHQGVVSGGNVLCGHNAMRCEIRERSKETVNEQRKRGIL